MTVVSVLLRHPIAEAVGVKQDWGGGARNTGRLPLPDAVHHARVPPGPRRLPGGRHQPGRRAGHAARHRRRAGRRRARRHRRVHRNPAVVRGDDGLLRGAAAPAARHGGARTPRGDRLWTHVRSAWAAIAALAIIAVLQNIDIIAAKHRFSTDLASSYSATAVAAKVLIWVAMGAGFYLVPEVSRKHSAGEDGRPVLAKALAIVGVAAIPCLLIYAFASAPADQGRVRLESAARGRRAVHPRGRVHGARRRPTSRCSTCSRSSAPGSCSRSASSRSPSRSSCSRRRRSPAGSRRSCSASRSSPR